MQRPLRISASSSAIRILYMLTVLLWKQDCDLRSAVFKAGDPDPIFRAVQVLEHLIDGVQRDSVVAASGGRQVERQQDLSLIHI